MAKIKINNEAQEDQNVVSYKKNVVHSIITLATKEIGGIASLSAGVSFFKRLFSSKYFKGIKLEYNKSHLYIDVFVNVYFGYGVNNVAYKVQENVKKSVESMTDFKVDIVNVHVVGVVFDSSEEEAAVI